MFQLQGKTVQLWRYKIEYNEITFDNESQTMTEYCISDEHRDEVTAILDKRGVKYIVTPIDQSGREWLNGMTFDTYDEAKVVYDNCGNLNFVRQNKLTEISEACHDAIVAGTDVETSQEVEHFSLDENDQINIMSNFSQAQMGMTTLYHADGKDCRPFSPDEMMSVATAAIQHKTYNITYHNLLKKWVNREADVDVLNGIAYRPDLYGADLPEDLRENLLSLLGGVANG